MDTPSRTPRTPYGATSLWDLPAYIWYKNLESTPKGLAAFDEDDSLRLIINLGELRCRVMLDDEGEVCGQMMGSRAALVNHVIKHGCRVQAETVGRPSIANVEDAKRFYLSIQAEHDRIQHERELAIRRTARAVETVGNAGRPLMPAWYKKDRTLNKRKMVAALDALGEPHPCSTCGPAGLRACDWLFGDCEEGSCQSLFLFNIPIVWEGSGGPQPVLQEVVDDDEE